MEEVRKELASLVWEQLYKNHIQFNFIRFSDRFEKWRDHVVESTEDRCHESIAWLASLNAHGNSCHLEALKVKDFVFKVKRIERK
jgi:hypothetical protein